MNSSHLWIAASTLLLASCASAPIVQPPAPLPEIPPLLREPVPQTSFIEQMQRWLCSSREQPIDYESLTKPASVGTNSCGSD